MSLPTVFILLINCIMQICLLKSGLRQLILICKRALTFSNNFLILPPPPTSAPKMTEIKAPFGPLIFYIDIGREMAALLFYWFCLQFCSYYSTELVKFH